jgi:hypothetical protein
MLSSSASGEAIEQEKTWVGIHHKWEESPCSLAEGNAFECEYLVTFVCVESVEVSVTVSSLG